MPLLSVFPWPTALISLFITLLLSYNTHALDSATMTSHLQAGKTLLGTFQQSSGNLSKWMSFVDDATSVQDMNIPGTHDSLTWSVNGIGSSFVQTQDLSLFDQLNNGVRFVDLRIGMEEDKVRFYHSDYLLDGNADLEDIFWGMYYWLDNNPTETVLVSVKIDNGNNTAALQQQVFNLLTSSDVSDYWVQGFTLPTLGNARHKLIPILRFPLQAANIANFTNVGIDLSHGWADNRANFSITYAISSADQTPAQVVYIEDLYNPDASDMKDAVDQKISALRSHVGMSTGIDGLASQQTPGKWYIAFASGYNGITTTPDEFATGSSIPTHVDGVNARLLSILTADRGKYFGVMLFDFYGHDLRMANATLGMEVASGALSRPFMSLQYLLWSFIVTAFVLC